jgi:N utilization substance protein A
MDASIFTNNELLQVADVVAREKAIDREEVLTAMEMAIQKAGRSRYGQDRDIRAMIDRKSGQITLEQFTEVVEEIEDEVTQITLDAAKKIDPTCRHWNSVASPPKQRSKSSLNGYAKQNGQDNLQNIRVVKAKSLSVR